MIRSTPSSSGSGNITPASTTMVVSAHEIASMFIPNSPSATISSISEADVRTFARYTPGGGDRVAGSRAAAHSGCWARLKLEWRDVVLGAAYKGPPYYHLRERKSGV